jgi:hypothetical protein
MMMASSGLNIYSRKVSPEKKPTEARGKLNQSNMGLNSIRVQLTSLKYVMTQLFTFGHYSHWLPLTKYNWS